MKRTLLSLICCGLISAAVSAQAATFYVPSSDPGAAWQGFMNVSELPSNGGGYVFGSGWGPADLTATWSGPVLTLGPNTINDPSPFWYTPSGGPGAAGNKIMDASYYRQDDSLSGSVVTFTGKVLSNTLTSAHTSVAFIKDFDPGYGSFISTTIPLTPGVFSITLATIPLPGRHVQFGFETIGVNVWSTDVGPYGSVQIVSVPEPATLAISTLGLIGMIGLRRRSR